VSRPLAPCLFAACLLLALPSRADDATPVSPPGWSFQVDARDLEHGLLSIEMNLRGYAGPLLLCTDMRGAGRSITKVRAMALGAEIPLSRDPDQGDCFHAEAPKHGPLVVRYQSDLGDLASHHGDPDFAARVGDGGFIFNDESVLLRPEPLPDQAPIEISFLLPKGVSVAAPWKPLDRAQSRFASDARQYDAGSYVALGKQRTLAPIESHGGVFEVQLLAGAHRASEAALRGWVEKAARAVGDFYGGVPTGRALVLLVPVAGESDPGVFGTTLHRAAPSVVMFFGADASDEAFRDDWMGTHELFHVGNPRLTSKVRWFNEGSATYYQDVLRARAGMVPPEKIWSDLYDGFTRFCAPLGGHSLADESEHLGERHHFVNVYWAGACLFFRADVLIREHSNGKRSLDDLLRALLEKSMTEMLDEDELIAALDEAAGGKQISAMLHANELEPLEPLYKKLGLVPIAKDRVKLDDAAKEAPLRRAILEARPTSAPRSSEIPR
jgi:predicted metalloprotease with PDZ domain